MSSLSHFPSLLSQINETSSENKNDMEDECSSKKYENNIAINDFPNYLDLLTEKQYEQFAKDLRKKASSLPSILRIQNIF